MLKIRHRNTKEFFSGLIHTHCETLRPGFSAHRQFSHRQGAKHLKGLNDAQYKIVTFPASTSLQVLAGPGSGKTKVLTSRIVELIQENKLPPSSICAVTFTRKAAREMQTRLTDRIGTTETEQLSLGTFHSVCFRYLKEYGSLIGNPLESEIWDQEDCTRLVYHIIALHNSNVSMKDAATVRQRISSAKGSPGDNPKANFSKLDDPPWMEHVFDSYQEVLKISKAMDFDDLLRLCLDLFNKAPFIPRLTRLQHVLVDEFQDTSELQYHLLRKMFGAANGRITIVGDPDQAIYAWRNADLTNTKEHLLEENYRSTESILALSHSIIKQDLKRPNKLLFTSQTPNGPKPVLKSFKNPSIQAEFIANEIQRLVELSDGMLGYGDCAILLREHSSSYEVTSSLRDKGIPYQYLRDTLPFNRPPCKILLAYLRIAVSSATIPSLFLALEEGPPRIDKKHLSPLLGRAIKEKKYLFDIIDQMCDMNIEDRDPWRQRICGFIRVIKQMRILLNQGAGVAELLKCAHRMTGYDAFLQKRWPVQTFNRKQHVQNLLKYAQTFSKKDGMSVRKFFDAIREYSKFKNAGIGVTIATAHSAKGLEWPAVFVPEGMVQGTYPHRRSINKDQIDEERRLLYVTCTRAQCLLYLTHPRTKEFGPEGHKKTFTLHLSKFLDEPATSLCQNEVPQLDKDTLELFEKLLGTRRQASKLGLLG